MKEMLKKIVKTLLVLFFTLPIIMILFKSTGGFNSEWFSILLPSLLNTFKISLGSIIISFLIWIPSALLLWLYKIKYKKIFIWWFILWLIFPSYILALLYSDIFTFLYSDYWLMFILWLSTSPYIFLLVYSSITNISDKYILSWYSLWLSSFDIIRQIILPLLKPSIIIWTLVVLAETFSEFGATFLLWVNTVIVDVYTLWFSVNNYHTASQFWLILIIILILVFLFFNPYKNNLFKYNNKVSSINTIYFELSSKWKVLAYFYLYSVILLLFIIPLIILTIWLLKTYMVIDVINVVKPLINTIILSFISVFIITIFWYIILRLFRKNSFILNVFTSIYSIPWIIIWVSVLIISPFVQWYILAYIFLVLWIVLKFTPIFFNNLYWQYIKINPKLRKVWYSLGRSKLDYLQNIEIPLLYKWFLSWWILIFLEVIRELPITLLLKPFNFDTLATKIFVYAETEQIYLISVWIVLILIISIIPIIYIYKNKIKF